MSSKNNYTPQTTQKKTQKYMPKENFCAFCVFCG